MKVIALINQKGGSGKTTLATSLADAFVRSGKSVVIGDCDSQQSARDWAAAAESDGREAVCPVIGTDRPSALRKPGLIHCDYLILDGAPKLENMAAAAICAADLVLMPISPSPYDLWAVDPVVEMIRGRREVTGGKPAAAFVVSRAVRRSSITAELPQVLRADYADIDLLESITTQRVAYARTAGTGQTVLDGRDKAARDEIMHIMEEIKKWL